MAPKILVVDSDEAFATMLKELLETDGGYVAEVAHTGREALERLRSDDYGLIIVDMGLQPGGRAYLELVQMVRRERPALRVVLIPFLGEDLPPEALALDVQGTLTKPFFADDLLPAIEEALTKPMQPPAPTPTAAPPAPPLGAASLAPVAEQPPPRAQAILNELVRETGADAALLISIGEGQPGVLARAGTLSQAGSETLASLIVAAVRAAQAAGRFLGEPDVPFEHNMFETGSLRLYAMAVPGGRLLAVTTPTSTPLGTIRHNLRRAARDSAAHP